MDRIREDARKKLAGSTHRALWESDAACARHLNITRQHANGWSHGHQSNPLYRYLEGVSVHAITRMIAELRMRRHKEQFEGRPTSELITDYHTLREMSLRAEATDTIGNLHPTSWVEVRRTSLADAALDLEIAAHEEEFLERGVSVQEVFSR
jgi:hypothetical protein